MKMLGNSSRGLVLLQKRQLYRCCALPIVLYSSQLQYYNKAPLTYLFKVLQKIQRRVALWISDIFYTSPSASIKAISDLISIYLHFKKLYGRFYFCRFSLLTNYIIKLIIDTNNLNKHIPHCLSWINLTPKQQMNIKKPLVDIDNRYNEFILSFFLFNREFSLGNRLINVFPKQFSFYLINRKNTHDVKNYLNKLDNIIL